MSRLHHLGGHVSGPSDVRVHVAEITGAGAVWSVANHGDEPRAVDAVWLRWALEVGPGEVQMFCNGHQSWSPCTTATVGVDEDASRVRGADRLTREVFHADGSVAEPGALRSELVTVLQSSDLPARLLVGFAGGADHDSTVWVLREGDVVEIRAEAHLGGAVLDPGEQRPLHDVVFAWGDHADDLLVDWAVATGRAGSARVTSPFVAGWCSWYQYFTGVTEADVRANLARLDDWPFTVFQVDDGYQRAHGDWLVPNADFPSGVEGLAAAIGAAGADPGIWLAPFLAERDAESARAHPEWLAHGRQGRPLLAANNPDWDSDALVLDPTHPAAQQHLEELAADLVDAGFTYLKLDFLYAPTRAGSYHDRGATPAQRVRAGLDAIRRGAGDDAFLLGCGCPLGPALGVVDGMRIGPDVAPWWSPRPADAAAPGYIGAARSVENAWRNTLARTFFHRAWWLNDPDCLILRRRDTGLSEEQSDRWADTVAQTGGLVLVSDDLGSLSARDRERVDRVIAVGEAADKRACYETETKRSA